MSGDLGGDVLTDWTNVSNRAGHTQVPNWLYSYDMGASFTRSATAKHVLEYLWSHTAGYRERLSVDRIADELGATWNTINGALLLLVDNGFVRTEQHRKSGGGTRTRIVLIGAKWMNEPAGTHQNSNSARRSRTHQNSNSALIKNEGPALIKIRGVIEEQHLEDQVLEEQESPPTTSSRRAAPRSDGSSEFVTRKQAVAAAYARFEIERNGGGIRDLKAVTAKHSNTALAHPNLDRWLNEYPHADTNQIAGWVAGNTDSMRYLHPAVAS